jgi:inosine/xanthosine triphosphatase
MTQANRPLTLIVASTNPVKIDAARQGFVTMFPDLPCEACGVSAPSGVSDQPLGDDETLRGATNRAANARALVPDADYWVGIEGGVSDHAGAMEAFAWVVVLGRERAGKSRTAAFILPEEVARLVRTGMELGDADDAVFGRSNSKQQNGAVGLLTGDAIDRLGYYAHAMVMALIPFKNPDLTFASSTS